MADLGSVGVQVIEDYHGYQRNFPAAFSSKNISLYIPIKGVYDLTVVPPGDYGVDRYSLRGFLKRSNGDPLSRRLVAVDEVSLQVVDSVVSDPATGAFELRPASQTNKCSVYHIPQVSDLRDGVIFTGLTPVPH